MASPSEIDLARLAALVRTRRGTKALRTAAAEIGKITAPTLSRIEQGNMPDLDTFFRLCRWLGEEPGSFRGSTSAETLLARQGQPPAAASPPECIEAYLRADRTLPRDTIEALSNMVKLAYRAAADRRLETEDS